MEETNKSSINEEDEDRLSSLPDAILIDILSRIPINSAATTSALSHRWRYLWTSTTHFSLSIDSPNFTAIVDHILGKLTSPKLFEFNLNLSSPTQFPEEHVIDSCFRRIFDRIVEKVSINVLCCFYEEVFFVPKSLLNSQFLVVLELGGKIKIKIHLELSENENLVQLPKLKKLKFDYLLDVPEWLGLFIFACPLLEVLELVFKLDVVDSRVAAFAEIFSHNIKVLNIDLECNGRMEEHTQFSICAPMLESLVIRDCNSRYCFVDSDAQSELVNACVDLRRDDEFVENDDDDDEMEDDGLEEEEGDYVRRMAKFVQGMCCVERLKIRVQSRANVFTYLNGVDDGFMPVFHNLTRFEATLDGIGLSGWKDLLLSLQHFPNLMHLKVNMEGDPPTEDNNWCPPDIVPDCLASKLKRIQVRGLSGIDDDLKLLAFILSNARHLCKLRLRVFIEGEYEKMNALGKEGLFCQSLFKLPRISSTCEVLFSGRSLRTSSNTFNIEHLEDQIALDA